MSDQDSQVLLINKQTLTNIANAIREKTSKTDKIYPSEMDEEIASISTGIVPTGNINISTNGSHDVTNYATATVNIDTESHPPITVNITQSEHQTITVTPSKSFGSLSSSGNVSCPTGLILTAKVTPDSGYQAGTLNQTTINNAQWGNTYTFSATAATVIPMVTVNFIVEWIGDNNNANNTRFDREYKIYESQLYSTNSSTIPLNSSNNWTYSENLKANTTYYCLPPVPPNPNYTGSSISSFTTSSEDNQTITLATYTYSAPTPPTPPIPA